MSSKKTIKVTIRISGEEEKKIEAKANIVGLSVGQYMRFISLQAEIEVKTKEMSDKKRTTIIKDSDVEWIWK